MNTNIKEVTDRDGIRMPLPVNEDGWWVVWVEWEDAAVERAKFLLSDEAQSYALYLAEAHSKPVLVHQRLDDVMYRCLPGVIII